MYHVPIYIQSSEFSIYVAYCKNKPVSDHARSEYEVFFSRRQSELGQKLNIEDLLIAPVQRLPKYQLLIRVSGCGSQQDSVDQDHSQPLGEIKYPIHVHMYIVHVHVCTNLHGR